MPLPVVLDAFERLAPFGRLAAELPGPAGRRAIAGLIGSSDAVLVAALARHHPNRFFVVVSDAVGDAERWLADLELLMEETPVALYPPREGFGTEEIHAEIAGERVETLERVSRAELISLLTDQLTQGYDRYPHRLESTVSAVAGDGGWRLTLTDDPREALPLLMKLVDGPR